MKTEKTTQPQQHDSTVSNGDPRRQMIEQAAYFRAESRRFAGDCPEQDWYEAEAAVDRMLHGPD